jgi:hypothetical protein
MFGAERIAEGRMPHCAAYISIQSLCVTRWCTGSQWSWIVAGVMWSRGCRPNNSLAAAFWTLSNGAIVELGGRRTKNCNSRAVIR